MKKIVYFILIFTVSCVTFAQDVKTSLQEYFEEPQEVIHLTLNKTSFIPGEHIWFQGFVANPKSKFLSTLRQNVKVSVFDAAGNLHLEALHLINGGTFKGEFEILDLKPGNYHIQAETYFLNQFSNPYIHTQSFKILGEENLANSTIENTPRIDFLPESGNLIYDIASNLGIKMTDSQGKGIYFKANLLADGYAIASFDSNKLGMAKVSVNPQKGVNYSVAFTTEKNTFTKDLPTTLIKEKGFIIQHQPINKNSRVIKVISNLDQIDKTNHFLLLHQDGKFGEIPLELDDNGEFSFILQNKNIFEGVNTLTYFYKGKPVAERLIFNRPKYISQDRIEVSKSFSVKRDSLSVKFDIKDLKEQFTKVSISVLDAENKVNNRLKNISSSFYLEPYVGGIIENPAYYFTNVTIEVERDVDLLLLTQGWSRFSWDEILNFDASKLQPKDSGIETKLTIGGGINKRWNRLLMFAGNYNDEAIFEVDKDNAIIEMPNFYPTKGETFTFALIDKKGKFKAPKNLDIKTNTNDFDPAPQQTDYMNTTAASDLSNLSLIENEEISQFNEEQTELLDEVKLNAKNSTDEYFVSHKEDYQFGYNAVRLDIDEEAAQTYPFVTDYLSAKGWRVGLDRNGQLTIINNRGSSGSTSIISASDTIQGRDNFAPLLIVNNIRFEDFSIIDGRRLDDFEYIIFDKTGYSVGLGAQGGVIRMRLRETPIFTEPTIVGMQYVKAKAENGYAYTREYFNPSYEYLDLQTYKEVGAIGWFTDMFTEDNTFTIQHLHTDAEKYQYYIEGVSENGLLVNLTIEVPTKL